MGASQAILLLAIFTFALAWGNLKLREPVSLPLQPKESAIVRLTILDIPRASTHSDNSWSCLARLRSIVEDSGSTPVDQNVWLSASSISPPRPGDRLVARGTFRPVEPPRNPGEFDLRRWAADRSIAGSFRVPAATLIRPDESRAGPLESATNFYRRSIGTLRHRASDTVDALAARASPDARELLRGLLLGENPPSPSEGLASFYQLGLAHILSISGFHLVVFAGAALVALRLFGDLGRLEPVLVAGAVLFFLAIVPASSPLVRAAAILLVLLTSELFGRRYDRLTLLCWTAVAILLFRPSELWSLGFQLSFGLTGALLALAQRLSLRLFPPPLGIRVHKNWLAASVRHALLALFVTGLLCWALAAPWIASTVGIFNPLSIITNILITPIIVLALWLGYAALIVGLFVPSIAELAAAPTGALADLAVATARWWDSLPISALRLPPLSTTWALAASVLISLWFIRARLRLRPFIALACALVAWAALETLYAHRLPADVTARIYLLDESPANCTIIRTRDHAIMINAGTSSPSSQGRDLAQVARYLGAWRLDTLILDASDPRAFSGAPEVIRNLRPATVIIAGEAAASQFQPEIARAVAFGARVQILPSVDEALKSLTLPLPIPSRIRSDPPGMKVIDLRSAPE